MLFAFLLAAGMAAADTVAPDTAALRAPQNLRAGAVSVHRQPALPMVALRLSLLTVDPPGYAGAGLLFQRLHFPSLRDQVQRVGGRVQMQRSSDALVYTVIGPAVELEYLAGVLRSALVPPAVREGNLVVAQHALREARLAEWEVAPGHVRAAMRVQLFPDDLSVAGTETSVQRLDLESLPAVWTQMYHPDRVAVIAVGDVRLATVEAAFGDLPPPPSRRLRSEWVDTAAAIPLAPAEATRGWLGMGYPASDLDPAILTVIVRLLRDDLHERMPAATVEVEHWWTHYGQALAAVVAVPGPELPVARRTLGTALATLQEELDEVRVRRAATLVRREMLFYARTPERMAEVLGSFADRDGNNEAAHRFYADLEQVSLDEVRSVLAELSERTPARVDIPPQPLDRR